VLMLCGITRQTGLGTRELLPGGQKSLSWNSDEEILAELPGSQNKFSVIGGMVVGCSRLEVGC
jgi:hypothetical protein